MRRVDWQADPTSEEEALQDSTFTVVVDEQQRFRGVHKAAGQPITIPELKSTLAFAKQRTKEVLALIDEAQREFAS